jgi:hypothetical protein
MSAENRRLWLTSVVAIVAILLVGIVVSRSSGNAPSTIAERLAAAVVVTVLVAAAKIFRGPRAAAITGIVGTLIAVIVLIALG